MGLGTCRRWLRLACLCVALPTLLLGHAQAERRPTREVERLARQLTAPELNEQLAAIDGLGALGTVEAVRRLADLVHEGQPDAVVDRVVAALGLRPSRASVALLAELALHRRPAVRMGAHAALAGIVGTDITELLSEGLRDGQAEVRAHSARLLGERGDASAVPVLFLAFERGVSEAAEALGRLAPAADLARYGTYLERRPLHVMLAGYTCFIERRTLDEASKLRIISTLEQVSGPLVKQWLRTQLAKRTDASEQRIRFALAASLARVVEHPDAASPASAPTVPKP